MYMICTAGVNNNYTECSAGRACEPIYDALRIGFRRPADETVCPTSLAVQGFAKLGGAGGFACRACFSHLLTLWVIWTVSGLVFITFLSAAGPLRQVRRRRGARTPACRVETPALLFDTVCESCARTGRREKSRRGTQECLRYVGDHLPHSGSSSFLNIRRSEPGVYLAQTACPNNSLVCY